MADASHINDRASAALFHRFWEGGRANETNFDPAEAGVPEEEWERGIEIEHEHSPDDIVADRIALDHLAEDALYYVGLDLIERLMERGMLGEVLHMVQQSLPIRTSDLLRRHKKVVGR